MIRELESIVEDYNLECINDFKEDNFEGMDILKQIIEVKGYETLKEFFAKYSLTIEDFMNSCIQDVNIPGISIDGNDKKAFIQLITNNSSLKLS